MGYLTPGDYKKSIQADNLMQVIGSDPFVLEDAEQTAVEDVDSGLKQRFLTDREFTPTLAWDGSETYTVFERVYLTAATFSATATYNADDLVAYAPNPSIPVVNIYRSIAGSVPHAFVPSEWELVAQQYTIYSPVLPAAEFNINAVYKIGDVVLWNDKLYTAIQATNTTADYLQYITYDNIPPLNVAPDDPLNGQYFWGVGVPYNIPPGTAITDTTKWVKGDNRSKQVVWCVVALTLYYIHARIAPRNVPDLRIDDKTRADKQIKMFAEGDKTPKLPTRPKPQGKRIRWGGNIKNNNTW